MANKTVSVYINAYNAENYIEETVNSILGQTFKDIKLVVIDDCSTDSTLDLLKCIKDSRLTVYSLPRNSHIAFTLNEGLKYMDGDYIAHCDADDVWESDKIQKQFDFLEAHPEYGACFTKVSIIDERGVFDSSLFPTRVFDIPNASQSELFYNFCDRANHFHHSSFFARREIIEKVGNYDLSMPTLHDYDYWLRLLTVTPVYIIDEPLMRYRIHGENHSRMDDEKTNSHDAEYQRAIEKCIDICPDELFLEAFKKELCFDGPHTHEETVIEKALILSKIHTPIFDNPVSSVNALSKLLNNPDYRAILESKFNFTEKDINELQKKREYDDPKVERKFLSQIDALNLTVAKRNQTIEELNGRVDSLSTTLQLIENNIFWRMSKFPRAVIGFIRKRASRHRHIIKALIIVKSFIKGGPSGVKQKLLDLSAMTPTGLKIPRTISSARRKREESFVFPKDVKISILVPLYNTPLVFLKEMIQSVTDQTYKNWELCLADGSTDDFSFVGEYCQELAKADSRIKYEKLAENKGISENTNHCLALATGDYIALFDHDDYLHPSALFEVMKRICDGADFIYTDEVTFLEDNFENLMTCHLKPDFAPDNLIANNYICHFSVFKSTLVSSDKLFRTKYDGSQDHDLILRLTDAAEKIVHIPMVLYFWRSHSNSVAMDINSKRYAIDAGINAVHDFLASKGVSCTVKSSPAYPTIYKVRYRLNSNYKVSVIIPTKDRFAELSACIDSIIGLSSYDNYEIVIVDNRSTEEATVNYLNTVTENEKVRVIKYDKPFNFAALNNFAVENTDGDYLLFLNDDTKVITPDWIEELLMYAQREDVGAVGAKLFYANDTVQHAGIVLGLGKERAAGFAHHKWSRSNFGYMGKLYYAQNVSAVTAACMMISRELFNEVGGFDEELSLYYNDVDLCLKLRERGKLNILNAFCELYHYKPQSMKQERDEEKDQFKEQTAYFLNRWGETVKKGDPYYNPNFSLDNGYMIDPKKFAEE